VCVCVCVWGGGGGGGAVRQDGLRAENSDLSVQSTYSFPIFKECHVIATEGTNKEDGPHIIKTRDPLSSFRALTTYINHPGGGEES
jgi:hypothetical protein